MAELRGGTKMETQIEAMLRLATNASAVHVGFLQEATYPDGKPVALIAAIHNYGRWPFFTNMIAAKKPEWPAAVAALLVANKYDALSTLQMTGEAITGQLRQAIVDTVSPPNAPATIKRKGFDKPLIHSGHLLNSADYQVKA